MAIHSNGFNTVNSVSGVDFSNQNTPVQMDPFEQLRQTVGALVAELTDARKLIAALRDERARLLAEHREHSLKLAEWVKAAINQDAEVPSSAF